MLTKSFDKKLLLFFCALLTVLLMALTGCGGGGASESTNTSSNTSGLYDPSLFKESKQVNGEKLLQSYEAQFNATLEDWVEAYGNPEGLESGIKNFNSVFDTLDVEDISLDGVEGNTINVTLTVHQDAESVGDYFSQIGGAAIGSLALSSAAQDIIDIYKNTYYVTGIKLHFVEKNGQGLPIWEQTYTDSDLVVVNPNIAAYIGDDVLWGYQYESQIGYYYFQVTDYRDDGREAMGTLYKVVLENDKGYTLQQANYGYKGIGNSQISYELNDKQVSLDSIYGYLVDESDPNIVLTKVDDASKFEKIQEICQIMVPFMEPGNNTYYFDDNDSSGITFQLLESGYASMTIEGLNADTFYNWIFVYGEVDGVDFGNGCVTILVPDSNGNYPNLSSIKNGIFTLEELENDHAPSPTSNKSKSSSSQSSSSQSGSQSYGQSSSNSSSAQPGSQSYGQSSSRSSSSNSTSGSRGMTGTQSYAD